MSRPRVLALLIAFASTACGGGGGSKFDDNPPNLILRDPAGSASGFGRSIAQADFNGDGNPDLAIGADGRVFLYEGRADGTYGLLRQLTTPPEMQQLVDRPSFGTALGAVDTNDDGRADLLVGDPDAPVGPLALAGKVFIYVDPLGATQPVPTELIETTPQGGARFGRQIACAPEDDVPPLPGSETFAVIGAPEATVGVHPRAGRITEVAFRRNLLVIITANAVAPSDDEEWGSVLCVSDLDRDDVPDVIVGRMGVVKTAQTRTGHVTLIRRTTAGDVTTVIDAPVALGDDADFGWSIAAGDVDGDGRQEIAIGCARAVGMNGVKRIGAVVIVTMRAGMPPDANLEILYPPNERDQDVDGGFGECVSVGTIDPNGRNNLYVWAPKSSRPDRANDSPNAGVGVLYGIAGLDDLALATIGDVVVGARANLSGPNQLARDAGPAGPGAIDQVFLCDSDLSGFSLPRGGSVSRYACAFRKGNYVNR